MSKCHIVGNHMPRLIYEERWLILPFIYFKMNIVLIKGVLILGVNSICVSWLYFSLEIAEWPSLLHLKLESCTRLNRLSVTKIQTLEILDVRVSYQLQ